MLEPLPLPTKPLSISEMRRGGQVTSELIMLVTLLTVAVILMMPYLKRASAGRIYNLIISLRSKPFGGEKGATHYRRNITRDIVIYHNFSSVNNKGDLSSDELVEHVTRNEIIKEVVSEKYEVPI